MKCVEPVILKNGLIVPCGKCPVCLSNNRNQWTNRLCIHVKYQDRMPLFITLTYDNEHLPVDASLHREHISAFLKAYKRKYGLKNDVFTYFGCGEYGDDPDCSHRPHYHLLFFNDDVLYRLFYEDEIKAREHISAVWKNGFSHICIAKWSGIHYVTKYCLKEDLEDIAPCKVKPFTIASNNLGMSYLDSPECKLLESKLNKLTQNFNQIYEHSPFYSVDDRDSVLNALDYWRRYVPDFRVEIDNGDFVPLPRALRKKIVGSFEHFKDSPLWVWNNLRSILDSIDYYNLNGDLDAIQRLTQSMEQTLSVVRKIQFRKNKKRFDKNHRKL